jgi:serine/threonine protein kinase
MAPEMLLGDPSALSPRTDVYLLGAILYEIFAGEPPHRGTTCAR